MAARKRRTIKALTVAAAFGATMLVAACGAGPSSGAAKDAGQVIALNQMSVLRALFNRDMGHARLVLIFSPT